MIITLDLSSEIPLYLQLRNQIVIGIGSGELNNGEKLPTVRQMAQDAGVNTMTVNKTYQMLKSQGFIEIDRRKGAIVTQKDSCSKDYEEKVKSQIELLAAEAKIQGMKKQDFLELCETIFAKKQIRKSLI